METSLGSIVIELDSEKAPKTVENFLRYLNDGFYENTIFHRVINGFMIQGGGYTKDFQSKSPTYGSIANEANNGLKNAEGTIAMARTSSPHSASSQFFINVADNTFLNHTTKTVRGWGYTVFGKVVKGMEVVDIIKTIRTGSKGFLRDVPQTTVIIEKVFVVKEKSAKKVVKEESIKK
ncbi:peptidylprolyl isomerase [Candidatus Parabeggiatoa sp. HSG14]|uniref:peptidylprolyl isomerase n=1 Tax=Candidatus Parabeggiatoa sp. HSG14 TaxID=3055593 RepID=UPI0032E40A9A